MTVKEKRVFAEALATYGSDAQRKMLLEEMSELQKEICKNWRGRNNLCEIAEEIADVEIMLDQMKILFQNSDLVRQFREQKVDRLHKRLTAKEG